MKHWNYIARRKLSSLLDDVNFVKILAENEDEVIIEHKRRIAKIDSLGTIEWSVV